jgi:hypothetical protein
MSQSVAICEVGHDGHVFNRQIGVNVWLAAKF